MGSKFALKNLILKNYRCFARLALSLEDDLTVFVAPNGGGKTAVLDGIATALKLFVDTMQGVQTSKGFDATDIRLVLSPENKMEPVTPVRLEAKADFFGRATSWTRERHSQKSSRTTTAEAVELKTLASELLLASRNWAEGKESIAPLFPLISYYGTGRLWNVGRLTENNIPKNIAPNARSHGYADCLSSSSHFKFFADWFKRFSYEAKKEKHATEDTSHDAPHTLRAVQAAVNTALAPSGWHQLEWDFVEDTIVANHSEYGCLPVGMLSDGIRNMIGLVADIAHRAARLNPQLGGKSAVETPGIVLIDEVDLHLHPEWQQKVLQSLRDSFPLIQFIVTTHSPQVLTTVPTESIRELIQNDDDTWAVIKPNMQTRGVDSADVLANVMHVDPVPNVDEAQRLNDYRALIEEGKQDEPAAQSLRERLVQHFGSQHPVILDCDRLIRFQTFKRQRSEGA